MADPRPGVAPRRWDPLEPLTEADVREAERVAAEAKAAGLDWIDAVLDLDR